MLPSPQEHAKMAAQAQAWANSPQAQKEPQLKSQSDNAVRLNQALAFGHRGGDEVSGGRSPCARQQALFAFSPHRL
jgi:hypothetical protein